MSQHMMCVDHTTANTTRQGMPEALTKSCSQTATERPVEVVIRTDWNIETEFNFESVIGLYIPGSQRFSTIYMNNLDSYVVVYLLYTGYIIFDAIHFLRLSVS